MRASYLLCALLLLGCSDKSATGASTTPSTDSGSLTDGQSPDAGGPDGDAGGPDGDAGGPDGDASSPDGSISIPFSRKFPATLGKATAVAADLKGNVVVTGYFSGTVDFGGGLLTSAGDSDAFLASFGPDGTHRFSKRFGGASVDEGNGVAVDSHGNITITGTFSETVDFGAGPLVSAGRRDIFLASYDENGTPHFAKRFGRDQSEFGSAVAVDADGNIFVTGHFYYSSQHPSLDLGGGLIPTERAGVFLASYTATGGHRFSKVFASGNQDWAKGVATGPRGRVAITGYSRGTLDFGGGPLANPLDNSYNGFTAVYDADGKHVFSRRFGGLKSTELEAVAIDRDSNVVVAGHIQVVGGTGLKNGVVTSYSDNGQEVYSKQLSGPEYESAWAVASDSVGNVVVAGNFRSNTVDFGGGPLINSGNDDIFVVGYDSSGGHRFSKAFGDGKQQVARGVAVDHNGDVIVVGSDSGAIVVIKFTP